VALATSAKAQHIYRRFRREGVGRIAPGSGPIEKFPYFHCIFL
jgi:hypothetical protein